MRACRAGDQTWDFKFEFPDGGAHPVDAFPIPPSGFSTKPRL
jgi:hypothetical protein